MIKQEYVIKKDIKLRMLFKTFPKIFTFLEFNNNNTFMGKDSHLKDAINSIYSILNNNEITYKDCFFILFALSQNFIEIENNVKNNNLNFDYIKDEKYWENNEVDLNASIFFCYTFLNSLYKEELSKDFIELNNINEAKDYINFRKNILNKK
jgi:hypothetical protein